MKRPTWGFALTPPRTWMERRVTMMVRTRMRSILLMGPGIRKPPTRSFFRPMALVPFLLRSLFFYSKTAPPPPFLLALDFDWWGGGSGAKEQKGAGSGGPRAGGGRRGEERRGEGEGE
jgi:hypothetical protein